MASYPIRKDWFGWDAEPPPAAPASEPEPPAADPPAEPPAPAPPPAVRVTKKAAAKR
jgi:hypothetical protein